MEIGSKELVATKIPAPTNEERDKEKILEQKLQNKQKRRILKNQKTLT